MKIATASVSRVVNGGAMSYCTAYRISLASGRVYILLRPGKPYSDCREWKALSPLLGASEAAPGWCGHEDGYHGRAWDAPEPDEIEAVLRPLQRWTWQHYRVSMLADEIRAAEIH